MDFRDSVSKPFKKLKGRFAKDSRRRGGVSGKDHDAEGSGTDQSSRLHLETENVMERGPSQKENDGKGKNVVQADPPTSAPSIDNRKPNSERKKILPSFLS